MLVSSFLHHSFLSECRNQNGPSESSKYQRKPTKSFLEAQIRIRLCLEKGGGSGDAYFLNQLQSEVHVEYEHHS